MELFQEGLKQKINDQLQKERNFDDNQDEEEQLDKIIQILRKKSESRTESELNMLMPFLRGLFTNDSCD